MFINIRVRIDMISISVSCDRVLRIQRSVTVKLYQVFTVHNNLVSDVYYFVVIRLTIVIYM